MFDWILPGALLVLGLGFLAANLRLAREQIHYLRRRPRARLVWPARRPAYYGLYRPMGVTLALVIVVKLVVLRWPPVHVFGETMMFLYYACFLPLSLQIRRGFYEDGLWLDAGFMPYGAIGNLIWREGPELMLLVIPRARRLARRLIVPSEKFGEARRLLRDRIAAGDIRFEDEGLRLGLTDERDRV